CLPDLPAYGSFLMFLNPHTNWLFRFFSRASCESVTALKLWLALQQTPSRSPRACNKKMSLFSFWAFSLASPREESQWICSVSLWTFCSTTWLGILGGAFLPPAAQGTTASVTSKVPVKILYINTHPHRPGETPLTTTPCTGMGSANPFRSHLSETVICSIRVIGAERRTGRGRENFLAFLDLSLAHGSPSRGWGNGGRPGKNLESHKISLTVQLKEFKKTSL